VEGDVSAMRLLLAEPRPLMLAGIRSALEGAEQIEIVGEATTGSQVLPLVARLRPDVVLLELFMPGMDGFTCLELLRERHPKVAAVVLSVSGRPEHVDAALRRGARGYVVKTIQPRDLAGSIRQAVAGTFYTAVEEGGRDLAAAARREGLTSRELTVLQGVAGGMTNAALAKELFVAEQTIKYHLTNIYRKIGVANRTEAARYAFSRGLVPNPLTETSLPY
jgi:DNA-binding NarL/FixJ family response regulator